MKSFRRWYVVSCYLRERVPCVKLWYRMTTIKVILDNKMPSIMIDQQHTSYSWHPTFAEQALEQSRSGTPGFLLQWVERIQPWRSAILGKESSSQPISSNQRSTDLGNGGKRWFQTWQQRSIMLAWLDDFAHVSIHEEVLLSLSKKSIIHIIMMRIVKLAHDGWEGFAWRQREKQSVPGPHRATFFDFN